MCPITAVSIPHVPCSFHRRFGLDVDRGEVAMAMHTRLRETDGSRDRLQAEMAGRYAF